METKTNIKIWQKNEAVWNHKSEFCHARELLEAQALYGKGVSVWHAEDRKRIS